MKYRYILSLIFILLGGLLIFVPMNVFAISGPCSNCHTMHNSQGGETMSVEGDLNGQLLKATGCMGCHGSGNSLIAETQNPDGTITRTPQVYFHELNDSLAGGNFFCVDKDDSDERDQKGHNVDVLTTNPEDYILFNKPPGFKDNWDGALTCAGPLGCHGKPIAKGDLAGEDPEDALWNGIKGAHHSNRNGEITGPPSEETDGEYIGGGYRFLPEIEGYEDDEWEDNVSASKHNIYKGSTDGTDTTTISAFCARCHGNFHSNDQIGGRPGAGSSGSPWLRHPTDIDLPPGEYQSYNTLEGGDGKYNPTVPLGRTSIPSDPSATDMETVTPSGSADDIVTCLSCHRAHASNYPDALRWNYDDMVAGSQNGEGCIVCHTGKY